MWIFMKNSFVSVVQHRKYPDVVIVRARRKEHLEALGFQPVRTKNADYLWRSLITKALFYRQLELAVKAIDYPNFKNASKLDHELLMRIWELVYQKLS